jgi:hypothetical protein
MRPVLSDCTVSMVKRQVNYELGGVWKEVVMTYSMPQPVMSEMTEETHGNLGHDQRYFDVHSDRAPIVYKSTRLVVQGSRAHPASYSVGSDSGGLVVSMLASGTQVRGFEAVGFFGRNNPQHAFLPRGSKVPCRRFAACKRSLWSRNRRLNWPTISRPIPSFTNRGLACRLTWSDSGDDGRS